MAQQREREDKPMEARGEVVCPICGGSGRVTSASRQAAARKGGNISFLRSTRPGAMSMRQRGRRGGRPRALTLADVEARATPKGDAA